MLDKYAEAVKSFRNAATNIDKFAQKLAGGDYLSGGGKRGGGGGGGGPFDSLTNYFKFGLAQSVIGKIYTTLTSIFGELLNLQKSLLAFGTNTEKFTAFLGDSIKGLDGSTLKNLRNAATLYGMGFRENNRRLLEVASIFDRTGQDTKLLLEAQPELAFNLRMNSAQVADLAVKTLATGEKYGMASDKLIKVVSQLPVFKTAGLTEFGPQLATAFKDIVARLGPAGESVAQFANTFLVSQEGMAQAAAAGVLQLRGQFEKAVALGDREKAFSIIREAAEKISAFTKNTFIKNSEAMQGSIGQLASLGMMGDLIGEVGNQAVKSADAFKNYDLALKNKADKETNYSMSLETAILELTNVVVPPLIVIVQGLTYVLDIVGKAVNSGFGIALIALYGFSKIMQMTPRFLNNLHDSTHRTAAALRYFESALRSTNPSLTGMQRFGRAGAGLLGILGGPIGIGLTALAVGIPLLAGLFQKNTDDTRRMADAQQRATELAEEEARARSRNEQLFANNAYSSFFESVNRDMMFAVTNLRVGEQQAVAAATQTNDHLRYLVATVQRFVADSSVPRNPQGGNP